MLLRFFFPTTCRFQNFFPIKTRNFKQHLVHHILPYKSWSDVRSASKINIFTYVHPKIYVRTPKNFLLYDPSDKKSKNMFFRRQIPNITINAIFFCGHFDVQFIHFRIKFMKKFLVKSILTYPYTVLYGKKKKKNVRFVAYSLEVHKSFKF